MFACKYVERSTDGSTWTEHPHQIINKYTFLSVGRITIDAHIPDDGHDGIRRQLAASGRRCPCHCPRPHRRQRPHRLHHHSWPAAPHAGGRQLQRQHGGHGHGASTHGGGYGDEHEGGRDADGDGGMTEPLIATSRLVPSWRPHLSQTGASPQNFEVPRNRSPRSYRRQLSPDRCPYSSLRFYFACWKFLRHWVNPHRFPKQSVELGSR